MKKRIGFVSNSSSSSFVLIVTKEGHEKALEKLNPYQKAVANTAMEEDEIFGVPVMVFGELSVMDYGFWDYTTVPWKDEYEGLDGDGAREAFHVYQQALPEGSEVFSWSEYNG